MNRDPTRSETKKESESESILTRHGPEVVIRGHTFRLLDPGGLYWPNRDALLVADLHLGKEATFQRNGIAVPRGSTEETLRQLSGLLEVTRASKAYLLGDLFHDHASLTPDVIGLVRGTLERHARTEVIWIGGNHDRRLGRVWDELPVRFAGESERVGPVELSHFPSPVEASEESDRLRIAGHLHPSVRLPRRYDIGGVFRCFWYSGGCLVLPALGRFTGTHPVRPRRNDRVWMLVEGRVVPMPKTK